MGGRSSEHDISLASAGLGDRGARAIATTRSPVEIDREGRWALPAAAPPELEARGRQARPSRRCPFRPSPRFRRLWRGSTSSSRCCTAPSARTAPSRACSSWPDVPYVGPGVLASALCMDKDVFKAVLRDRGIPVTHQRHPARRRPGRASLRLPGLRQAGAARLLGRHQQGARRERARAGAGARLPPRREGADRGVRGRRSRSSAACSATSTRSPRSPARSSPTPSGTTSRPSTRRAGWS